jgi:MFS transporter, DHA2 family, multidrug resistance protein
VSALTKPAVAAATLAAAAPPPPQPPGQVSPQASGLPWLGLTAVLMGTFISTLSGRFSSFALADIRGALHAGFDEGAWITTAQTAAQMLIAPVAVWAGSIWGSRQILIASSLTFAVISLITPLSPNLPTLLAFQFIGGLASGCFVPLTLSFILRFTPPKLWAYGVAVYALNLELSLNISASMEGWWSDHWSWHWIFWQNIPLALIMAVCVHFGTQRMPPLASPNLGDLYGVASFSVGLALIYAALDQGNRLDWLNSGLVCGLLIGGAVLLAACLLHELVTPDPWLDLKAFILGPLPFLLLLIALLRLSILSTSILIPQYLGTVRGFRALEVGNTLIWIAIPQLVLCPISAFMLTRTDPRVAPSIGLVCIGCACIMVATGLTPSWGSDEFLLSQLLQALGQSLALSGIVFYNVLHIKPELILTFGAMLQTARLMGGELGSAFVTTMARLREQHASNLIGLHLQAGSSEVVHRLQQYAAATSRSGIPDPASGTELLGRVVRVQATTQGVIDTYAALGVIVAFGLLIMALLDPPPLGPASPRPLFRRTRRQSS